MILLRTAHDNGGRCVPCARGTREQFERNRQYYIEQKRYEASPEWQFWLRLVRMEWADMTPAQQLYYAVNCVRAEVANGGFDQFFWNSSGDHHIAAAEGFLAMGAGRPLELLRRAKTLLFEDGPISDQTSRWQVLKAKDRPEIRAALDELDRAFWLETDDIVERMRAFALQHNLYPLDPA